MCRNIGYSYLLYIYLLVNDFKSDVSKIVLYAGNKP